MFAIDDSVMQGEIAKVIKAIEGQGQADAMREGWGDEFDPLITYLAIACSHEIGMGRLQAALEAKPVARTMVITGERCTGKAEDGSDSPILVDVAKVTALLEPRASQKPDWERNGREPDALSVIFSGGQTLTRVTGEYPGSELAEQFHALTKGQFASRVQFENLSLNTGDQGTVLGGLLWARNVERIVIVHVVDHIARFAATVLEGWRANLDGRLSAAHQYLDTGEFSMEQFDKINRPWPEVHLIPVGSFDDVDPRRGKNGGISRAREAFGPPQSDDECVLPGKKLGEEYAAKRYGVECLPRHFAKSATYACRALSPTQMLRDVLRFESVRLRKL